MSVRVAIGLNLSCVKSGNISSHMRLVSDDGAVQRSAIACAEVVHLKNIKPVIHSDVLLQVQTGKRGPAQCSFLTGELVAWQGTYGEHLPDEWKDKVEPMRLTDMFAGSSDYKEKIKDALVSTENASVNFNPSYNVFYSVDENRRPEQAFVGAKELVACWWRFVAIGQETREFKEGDRANETPPKYPAMISKIKIGAAQTEENVSTLLLDHS